MRLVSAVGVGALVLGVAIPVFATTEAGPLLVTVKTSPNPYAIEGTTSVPHSKGILAIASATSDSALEGYAEGTDSAGLEGFASETTDGTSNGVYGYSAAGAGVYGVGGTNSDQSMGVFGTSNAIGVEGFSPDSIAVIADSPNGIGVDAEATSGTGVLASAGLDGVEASTTDATSSGTLNGQKVTGNSSGVIGIDTTTSTSVTGDSGVSGQSTNGTGVLATSGTGAGLIASSASNTAIEATTSGGNDAISATTPHGFGLVATSNGTTAFGGTGVLGIDGTTSSSTANDAGVTGSSTNGQGVYGSSSTHQGVLGVSDSDTGAAGISTSGIGVVGESDTGPGLDVFQYQGGAAAVVINSQGGGDVIDANAAPSGSGNNRSVMSLDANGNMILLGSLTEHGSPSSTVRDATGAERVAYAQRATQSTIEDFGRAQVVNGRADVRLDPAFASTLASGDYLVFLTPEGPANTLYATSRSLGGFAIRENGGSSTTAVDYRIVGHPRLERPEVRLGLYVAPHAAASTTSLAAGRDALASVAAHRRVQAQLRAFASAHELRYTAHPIPNVRKPHIHVPHLRAPGAPPK